MQNSFSILFDLSPGGVPSDKSIGLGEFNTLKDCIEAAKMYTKLNRFFQNFAFDDFFEIAHYFKVIQYEECGHEELGSREIIAIVTLDVILEDNPMNLSSYSIDK